MIPTLLALAAAISWGVGDFLGGLMSRRLATTSVMVVSQGFGMIAIAIVFIATESSVPKDGAAWYAIGAGSVGAIGLAAFYRALAMGMVSIVAPIAATGVIVPVAVGLWDGEVISTLGFAGIAAAIGGVVLSSVAPAGPNDESAARPADRVQSLLLAIVAAVLFGAYFALFAKATESGVFGAALYQRAASLTTVTVMWVVARRGPASTPAFAIPAGLPVATTVAGLAGAGMLDIAANVLYGGASMSDLLSIAAVLSSLYPVVTVLMARIFLSERLTRTQAVGVVLALAGSTIIAAR